MVVPKRVFCGPKCAFDTHRAPRSIIALVPRAVDKALAVSELSKAVRSRPPRVGKVADDTTAGLAVRLPMLMPARAVV